MANRRKTLQWLQLAGLLGAVAMLATSGFSLAGTIKPYPGAADPDLDDDPKAMTPPKGQQRARGTPSPCKAECSTELGACAMACGGAKELKEDEDEKLKKDMKAKKANSLKQTPQDKCVEKCAVQQQKCLSACK